MEKIPEISNNKYDLPMLYPERKIFHVTEVTGFFGLMGYYFFMKEEFETAEAYDSILQEIAPDHPLARRLHNLLFPWGTDDLLSRVSA